MDSVACEVVRVVRAGAGEARDEPARLPQGDEPFVVGVPELGPQRVRAAHRREVHKCERQLGILLGHREPEAPGERLLRVCDLLAVAGGLGAPHHGEQPRGAAARPFGQGAHQVECAQTAEAARLLGGGRVDDGRCVERGELHDPGGQGVGVRLVEQSRQVARVGGVENVAAGTFHRELRAPVGDDERHGGRAEAICQVAAGPRPVGEEQPAALGRRLLRVWAGLPAGLEEGAVQR